MLILKRIKIMRNIIGLLAVVFTLSSFVSYTEVVVKDGKYFNEDGSLFTGAYEQFDAGTKIATISVSNGLLSGSAVYYNSNGTVKEEGSFKAGMRSGNWFQYTASGQLSAIASFDDDKKNGKWTVWDDAGNKRVEMYYDNGIKVGTWKMWDAEGNLTTKTFEQ
jgi:antitoxin component YwqK of YwqJK toxin-antitoxin module